MCEYLQLRGSTYYFRRPIPKGLERLLRDHESRAFQRSLRTKDKKEAKRLRTQCIAITDEIIAAAERRRSEPSVAVVAPVSQAALQRQREREWQEREYEELVEKEQGVQALEEAERVDKLTDLESRYAHLADAGWDELTDEEAVIKSLMETKDFLKDVARDRQTATESLYNASGREVAASWDRWPEVRPTASSESLASFEGLSLLEACTRWADERRVALKTRRDTEGMARRFIAVGGSKAVSGYSRADAIVFKDSLLKGGASGTHTNTVLRKLGTVFNWAVQNDQCAANPFNGIRVIGGRAAAVRQRQPFSLRQLRTVFGRPLFNGGPVPTRGRGTAAFWLPLLALYTGARREELGQLRVSDIAQDEYHDGAGGTATAWFISITDEGEGELSLKTEQSKRRVPIHLQLESLGLIDYWREMQAAGEFQLFPRLTAHRDGKRTRKWGEWFSSFLREDCSISDGAIVFHSFRHTFKAYARECGLSEQVQRQIMGHDQGDVADRYGGSLSDRLLVEAMAAYRIGGLDLKGLQRPE